MAYDAAVILPNDVILTSPKMVTEYRTTIEQAGSAVVVCASPLVEPFVGDETLVGWIFDWGRVEGMPINRKAWALYGRSPLFGPVVIACDSGRPIPDRVIDMIGQPIDTWVPDDVRAKMTAVEMEL